MAQSQAAAVVQTPPKVLFLSGWDDPAVCDMWTNDAVVAIKKQFASKKIEGVEVWEGSPSDLLEHRLGLVTRVFIGYADRGACCRLVVKPDDRHRTIVFCDDEHQLEKLTKDFQIAEFAGLYVCTCDPNRLYRLALGLRVGKMRRKSEKRGVYPVDESVGEYGY